LIKSFPESDDADELADNLAPDDIHPSVKMALLLTKKTLNWYYGRTDESNVYRISMILHPGLKMAYFKKQNRPSDWLDNARHIIRSEYQ
ncbi:hypothetical protein K438DRAFT_1447906, partial [Mycena galopus ATCC 62051]